MKTLTLLYVAVVLYACHDVQPAILTYEEARANCKPSGWEKQANGDSIIRHYGPECIKGALLPSFTATTMNEIVIDSAYFENKVSVINFWFIGCHPCEAEMPGFNKLVEKYKSEPVNFLAISRNSPTHVAEFLLEKPFNFEQVTYGEPIIVGNFQHIWGYPCTIVSDKKGKILYVETGGVTDSTAIDKIQEALIPVIDEALKG